MDASTEKQSNVSTAELQPLDTQKKELGQHLNNINESLGNNVASVFQSEEGNVFLFSKTSSQGNFDEIAYAGFDPDLGPIVVSKTGEAQKYIEDAIKKGDVPWTEIKTRLEVQPGDNSIRTIKPEEQQAWNESLKESRDHARTIEIDKLQAEVVSDSLEYARKFVETIDKDQPKLNEELASPSEAVQDLSQDIPEHPTPTRTANAQADPLGTLESLPPPDPVEPNIQHNIPKESTPTPEPTPIEHPHPPELTPTTPETPQSKSSLTDLSGRPLREAPPQTPSDQPQ